MCVFHPLYLMVVALDAGIVTDEPVVVAADWIDAVVVIVAGAADDAGAK